MNNRRFFFTLLGLVWWGLIHQSYAQSGHDKPLNVSASEIEQFRQQAEQMVGFLEFTLNSLGDPNVLPREKETIINHSYLKFFKNNKVQIEDDLLEGRYVVTNKDVQAYLKDIDFFFEQVAFQFIIEDISYNVNEAGQIFFVVTTTRNLNGITIDGSPVNNNQPRFIEINLDLDQRDLKIASIYTKRISENEDMRNWWSSLNKNWRQFFGNGIPIGNGIMLSEVVAFHNTWVLIERRHITTLDEYVMESTRYDTIHVSGSLIYPEIRRIWQSESIDLSASQDFDDITPLSKLTQLRTVNLTGTQVYDLTPIRNLTRLESLNISNTMVSDLSMMRFAINLRILDASKTPLTDLTPLISFQNLARLNISQTPANDLSPLAQIPSLRYFRLAKTSVTDFSPISHLNNLHILDLSNTTFSDPSILSNLHYLERLHAEATHLTSVAPLAQLPALQYLFIESTTVSEIQPLVTAAALERIYCDATLVSRDVANNFMQQRPDVLVVFETKALETWWETLPEPWMQVFKEMFSLSTLPTSEDLHKMSNITRVDVSGNLMIRSLDPLQRLLNLRELNASETQVKSLEPLRENIDLRILDVSKTGIDNLAPLSHLKLLEQLNISKTNVQNLQPLANLSNLQTLNIEITNVKSVEPLSMLGSLELLFCDNMNIPIHEIAAIYDNNPNVLAIFRTNELQNWLMSLNPFWKSSIQKRFSISEPISREQLHRLSDLRELDLSEQMNLSSLEPLKIFHRIEKLDISNTQTSDLSSVSSLSTLIELNVSNNPVNSVAPVSHLQRLKALDFSNTLVRDLSPVALLQNIEVLNISGTRVRSLKHLRNLIRLRQLDCFNTRIFSLRPLEGLQQLRLLRCYNSWVSARAVARITAIIPELEVVHY
ncbi:MAG TPA: hypothetical protein VLH16_06180 [Bacteroidales bacterium]|nr:hypothetical protein [Bacteroidales bacterium]